MGETKARAPSFRTLRWVAFTTALPFIGFGFMDNAILIIAGDAIDTSLGVTLGISTMCAAAIGNIVSDVAGIGCAAYIEEFCATTLKLPVPKLSGAQRQLRSVRMASQGGMAIGMIIGCVLGMIPLLFIDPNRSDKLREKARLERLYKDVLTEAKTLVEAESTFLWLRVDRDDPTQSSRRGVGMLPDYHPSVNGDFLYAMYYDEPRHRSKVSITTDTLMRMVSSGSRGTSQRSDGSLDDRPATAAIGSKTDRRIAHDNSLALPAPHQSTRVIPLGRGIVSRVVLTGTSWNIAGDLMDEDDFYPLSLETAGSDYEEQIDRERYRDCAVVPILDGGGRVIAVLEALNKERPRERYDDDDREASDEDPDAFGGFTDEDVEILVSLASHVSVILQRIYQIGEEDEEDFGLRDTIRILKESKGMKRSITRRKSMAASDGEARGSGVRRGKDVAGKKNTQLFPDSVD